jgi:hypothetical protein
VDDLAQLVASADWDRPIVPAADMPKLFPGTNDQTWAGRRHRGNGPVYVRVGGGKRGGRIYYRVKDIEAWLESNRFTRPDRPVNA